MCDIPIQNTLANIIPLMDISVTLSNSVIPCILERNVSITAIPETNGIIAAIAYTISVLP